MAPILFHELSQLGFPVVCVESRQAYQVLKSLATHKIDRNDARGLAHLARTGFFKPVHVKSLHAHALRALGGTDRLARHVVCTRSLEWNKGQSEPKVIRSFRGYGE